ncbi:Piso0_004915 [Millerozyma farinosa CBS 7064]|uniref:Piso0_004915 protein n=1 Tax=Pichia sorbitophila (strain ATCC MYA-4447 / BCRC 22081 / CBS 7064 / NBRC 10061 / NRRL Y-12695) TaxID=559304 RepID=G8Y3Q9_PICSO|nr:Piso0_004915 [Millerozyma farinosa CBS 7064]
MGQKYKGVSISASRKNEGWFWILHHQIMPQTSYSSFDDTPLREDPIDYLGSPREEPRRSRSQLILAKIRRAITILGSPSMRLENKGTVARDHLANERTFLAWLRTSLAFVSLGIGFTQLFRLEEKGSSVIMGNAYYPLSREHSSLEAWSKPLGIAFVSLGILTLFNSISRFFKVQRMLVHNYYPAARFSILLIVVVLAVIICISLSAMSKSLN